MPFDEADKRLLLAVKGVGPTVIARLEQQGFRSLAELAVADVDQIVGTAAALVGSTCWKNSPQARAAIRGAIEAAQAAQGAEAPLARPLSSAKPGARRQ